MPDWSSGLQGAGGGALAGAAVGGPFGAAIGGGIGLLGGLFGGQDDAVNKQQQMLQDYYNSVKNQQIAQAGPAATSQYSGFRQNQSDLINRLGAMASGQGPSLAAQQFQQATDQNISQQQAIAASGRGGPMAALTAANNSAGLGAQAAQGAAMGRTAEEMGALSQLGGAIAQGRGADEATNQFNAAQKNSTALANLNAQMQGMSIKDTAMGNSLNMSNQLATQPTMGQQILAGGAGMFALGAGNGGLFGKGGGASGVGGIGGLGALGGMGGGVLGGAGAALGGGGGGWGMPTGGGFSW